MRWRPVLPAAALLLVLTGCSGGSSGGSAAPRTSTTPASASPSPSAATPSVSAGQPNHIERLAPNDAVREVVAAAARQRSVHVSGTIRQGSHTFRLDLIAGSGVGKGTLRIGGGRVDLRRVDDVLYVRGDRAGLLANGASPAVARSAAGHWISQQLAGSTGDASSTAALVSVQDLFGQILKADNRVVAGQRVNVGGIPEYTLIDDSKAGLGTLYVTTTGDPLPQRIVSRNGHGSILFDHYNAPIHVTAPAHAVNQ